MRIGQSLGTIKEKINKVNSKILGKMAINLPQDQGGTTPHQRLMLRDNSKYKALI